MSMDPNEESHEPDAGPAREELPVRVPVFIERLAALARGAAGPVQSVGFFGIAFALAVWLIWLIPSTFVVWKVILSVVALGILLAPGVVVLLFHAGLSELIELPERFVRLAREGKVHAASAYRHALDIPATSGKSRLRRIARLLRSLFDARGALIDSYGTLLSVALAGRVLHPVTLVAVVIAMMATAALGLLAAIALLTLVF